MRVNPYRLVRSYPTNYIVTGGDAYVLDNLRTSTIKATAWKGADT
nr:MAG TPA: hypothetical protein [Caudoviricetes sp.]DAV78989.1 MAG TPA: hypothetical protein [Caudoviricetes sp.]